MKLRDRCKSLRRITVLPHPSHPPDASLKAGTSPRVSLQTPRHSDLNPKTGAHLEALLGKTGTAKTLPSLVLNLLTRIRTEEALLLQIGAPSLQKTGEAGAKPRGRRTIRTRINAVSEVIVQCDLEYYVITIFFVKMAMV